MIDEGKLQKELEDLIVEISKLAELKYSDPVPTLELNQDSQPTRLVNLVEAGYDFSSFTLSDLFGDDRQAMRQFLSELTGRRIDIDELVEVGEGPNRLEEIWREVISKIKRRKAPLSKDILGEYYPKENKIVLYQHPCWVLQGVLNIDESDLLSVVLAHEVTHAVTHNGVDIEKWWWKSFSHASSENTELFAQIYPYILFDQNNLTLKDAFLKLNTKQSGVYIGWKKYEHSSLSEINQALWIARREENLPEYNLPEYILPEDVEKLHDIIDDYENGHTPGGVKIYDDILPGCHPVTPKQIRVSAKPTSAGIIDDIFPGPTSSFNCIPSNTTGACFKTLVVAIASEDDAEMRILEAIEHIYGHCTGINQYVLFVAQKWDENVWRKHRLAFSGVGVGLRLLFRGRYELIDWHDKGPFPWEWRNYNRKVVKELNNKLTQSFDTRSNKYKFRVYQGYDTIGACTYFVIRNYTGQYHLECWIYRQKISIVWHQINGDKALFEEYINNITNQLGWIGKWYNNKYYIEFSVDRLVDVQNCAFSLFRHVIDNLMPVLGEIVVD